MEYIGAVVEHRPLVLKVPGSNLVMSGFCLYDCYTQTARVLVKSLKEADTVRDLYKPKACFAINVK